MLIEMHPIKIEISKMGINIVDERLQENYIEWSDFDQIEFDHNKTEISLFTCQKTYKLMFSNNEESNYTSFECFRKIKTSLEEARNGTLSKKSPAQIEELFVFALN